jgi:F0F1-type ATP synthase membrane subunit b/b'
MEIKTNAGKEELRQAISAFQERIKGGQTEFEETCTLNTQLKSVMTQAEQQAQELRNDFKKELQATRQDIIETTQHDLDATARDLECRLAAMDARTRRTGNVNVGTNAGQVMPRSSMELCPGRRSIKRSRPRPITVAAHPIIKPRTC